MNDPKFLCPLLLAIMVGAAHADSIVLSDSTSQQVRSCFQGVFKGYVASFDGNTFSIYVPLANCDQKRLVPANCGPQVVPIEDLPTEVRTGFGASTKVLHQKFAKDELTSVIFGGDIQGQCVVPTFGPPKSIKSLPDISWIAPTTSPDFIVAAVGMENNENLGKFYGVDWGSLYGKGLNAGDEITLMKSDFKGAIGDIHAKKRIAFGGAVGFERNSSTYLILGGEVTDVAVDRVRVKLERINSMSLAGTIGIGVPPSSQSIQVAALEVTAEVKNGHKFNWDALTSPGTGVQINPLSIRMANGKRHIRVESSSKVDGSLMFIKRRQ